MAAPRIEVEKFNGTGDYMLWKEKLMSHFDLLGLSDVLLEEEGSTSGGTEKMDVDGFDRKTLSEAQKKARGTIILSVSDNVLRKIIKEKKAASMLKTLDNLYMSKTLTNRIYLKQKLYDFKMSPDLAIEKNIDEFLKIISDLEYVDVVIPEEDQAVMLLMSLPNKFNVLRDTLRYSKETLKMQDVIGAIEAKELETSFGVKESKSIMESLFVKGKSKKPWFKSQGKGFQNNLKTKRGKFKSKKKSCWICGAENHFKAQCPQNKQNRSKIKFGESSNVNNQKDDVEFEVLCVYESLNVSVSDLEERWIIDSGCSYHMSWKRDWFYDIDESKTGMVRMANDSISEVKGIGSVKIDKEDGSSVMLSNVRYVPEMKRNLISVGVLEDWGCKFESEHGVLSFKKDNKMILQGKKKGGLYFVCERKGKKRVRDYSHEVTKDKTYLWHCKLGHMSQQGLDVLVKKGLLDKREVFKLGFCEDCVFGKTHRQKFSKGKHTSKEVLEYVHTDLWGSSSLPKSLGNNQYFLSIIDDFSRKVWIRFLKTKDDAFDLFNTWRIMVENQSNKKIKKVRTDNGLEFCNFRFDEMCRENGIVRHKTVAFTPQQNGVAERMNRTILNKVRCMLSDSGLSKAFWAEAAATSVHVINKSPSTAIGFQIPDELWYHQEGSYAYLRRFGCIAYVHNDDGKLNPRAKKGVFLGYPEGVKGYKIWLLNEKKIVVSRNVIFKEDEVFKQLSSSASLVRSNPDFHGSFDHEMNDGDEASNSREGLADTNDEQNQDLDHVEEELPSMEDYLLSRDRVKRDIKAPLKFRDNHQVISCYLTTKEGSPSEPADYYEAKHDRFSEFWINAMNDEYKSLMKNHTWILVKKPSDRKVLDCKWIFTRKEGIPGVEDPRFKARLVAKGFGQKEGIDYNEIFAPVVKHVSIRILLEIVAHEDLELEQLDVKTAFLHGELEEVIYMKQPEGFIEKGKENLVCLLKKSLYGLKQSPRQWNQKFNNFMMSFQFKRSNYDSCVYVKKTSGGDYIYLLLYVDDMLIASKSNKEIDILKKKLRENFEMKDLGAAKRILGMNITRDRKNFQLKLSQESYVEKILKVFNMENSKSVKTPLGAHFKLKAATTEELKDQSKYMEDTPYANGVGSVMYLMIGTRPDISYAVGMVSRFMSNPVKKHWKALQWIFKYLRGTSSTSLMFQRSNDLKIVGYSDSDFASDLDKRRSITGFVFTFGGTAISWKSSLQKVVALSTTEAEYISLTEAVKEAAWLQGLIAELGYGQEQVEMFCDSQSAIALAKNNVHHERTKHIAVKFHHIRERLEDGSIKVTKISTLDNPADIFTKVLPVNKLAEAMSLLQLRAD